ncbi:MAG: hypothetical protein GF398_15325 [Chitinivibrionales bacterium]|nr:hypothetical protein [Chitinivibrionales bacterium]
MFKRTAILLFASLTAFAPLSFGALKIGFINSQKILKDYEGVKTAQQKFEKEAAKWEQEAAAMQKELKDLKNQLEKQSLLLSNERKKELQDKFQQKYLDYQEFLQNKLGKGGDAIKKNEELTKPIIEKINKVLDKIGKEERYDYIFDAAQGGIVFAKKGYDLTERVLKELNNQQ